MNDTTPPLSPSLAAHVGAMAGQHADDARVAQAQERLLRSLPAPRRAAWPRLAVAFASLCAVSVLGVALLLGDQGAAFAAVQQRLRDFATLRLTVDQRVGGEHLQTSRILLDRSGSLRTDVGDEVTVVVDTRSRHVLTLLHGARAALRTPLPAGPAPGTGDALRWLDAIRDFQGEAQQLPDTRVFDGVEATGWQLDTQGMRIVLWADDDGVPHSMELGGEGGLALDYRFEFDRPIEPALLSADVPAGYTLQQPDAD